LIIAWIISFVLASKDKSPCISVELVGNLTFRQWLWADGGVTILVLVGMYITLNCFSN